MWERRGEDDVVESCIKKRRRMALGSRRLRFYEDVGEGAREAGAGWLFSGANTIWMEKGRILALSSYPLAVTHTRLDLMTPVSTSAHHPKRPSPRGPQSFIRALKDTESFSLYFSIPQPRGWPLTTKTLIVRPFRQLLVLWPLHQIFTSRWRDPLERASERTGENSSHHHWARGKGAKAVTDPSKSRLSTDLLTSKQKAKNRHIPSRNGYL